MDFEFYDLAKFEDARGTVLYNNNLEIDNFKRIYKIIHEKENQIRAWQYHKFESKIFIPISGVFKVGLVDLKTKKSFEKLKPDYAILDSQENRILHIPKGYANGLKSLSPNSSLLVLSDFRIDKSINEKIRLEENTWEI